MTPAQISQKPPKGVKPMPADRIADVLPFSKSEQNQVLFHPVDSFAFPPPPRLLASLLFLRTDRFMFLRGESGGCEQGQPGLGRRRLGWA